MAGDDEPTPGGSTAPIAAIQPIHVDIKPFVAAAPDTWFTLAEFHLDSKRVTKKLDRFQHLFFALPYELQSSFVDLIPTAPTAADPVADLKARLCQAYQKTPFDLACELLDFAPVSGDRPSVTMDRMLNLLPAGEPQGHLFKALFLRKQPVEIRLHLASLTFENCRDMGLAADKIHNVNVGPPCVASKAPIFAASSNPRKSRPRSRSSSPHHRRQQTPGPRRWTPPTTEYPKDCPECFYHFTYGPDARKCKAPCTFRNSKN